MQQETAEGLRDARRERTIGILLMCGALFLFSLLDATAKYLSRELPTEQIVWARYFANVVLVMAVLNPVTRPGVARSRKPWLQVLRSCMLLGSTTLNFIAVRYLQLTETITITFLTPLLVALLAAPILGERIGRERITAILVGFSGVLLVTRPGLGGIHPAAAFSLAGCVCYALYGILTRKLAAHDRAETTLVYSGLAGVMLLTPALPLFWVQPHSAGVWALMLSMGVYASVGHYLLILAHQRAPAAILSPFMYTQLLWMIAIGWFLFGDVPNGWTLAGGLVVVGSGLYLLSAERRKR